MGCITACQVSTTISSWPRDTDLGLGIGIDFLLCGALAVTLTGISKSGFAGGVGVIAVPVLSLFVSPPAAAAVMLPILCVIDVSNLIKYRKFFVKHLVYLLIPGALVGILAGTVSFSSIDPASLKIAVGILAIWFGYRTVFTRTIDNEPKRSAGPVAAFLCGALSGFTSFIAHAGGPTIKGFLLSQRLEKTQFVATNSIFFLVINQIKLIPYFFLGQFSPENLGLSLTFLPFALIGIVIGYRLHHQVSQVLFTRLICVFLVLSGVKLIWDGVGFYLF